MPEVSGRAEKGVALITITGPSASSGQPVWNVLTVGRFSGFVRDIQSGDRSGPVELAD